MNELVEAVSYMVNRSSNQTNLLFGLCDNDLSKLLKVEAYIKAKRLSACPGDKEAVDECLTGWDAMMRAVNDKKQ